MTSFTIPQESIAGLPTIEFHFDGSLCRAELSGAKLIAEAIPGDGERASLTIAASDGDLIADVMVRRVTADENITETVLRVGSALLWSHARWVEARAKQTETQDQP